MNLRIPLFCLYLLFIPTIFLAQNGNKKILDYSDFSDWKRIENQQISNDGKWIAYTVAPVEGDPTLMLYDANTESKRTFTRSEKPKFSADNQHLVFWLKPHQDSLKNMRRRKVKKDKLPKDTLCIYHLQYDRLEKIPQVKSYKLPDKWGGWAGLSIGARQKPIRKNGLPFQAKKERVR